MDTNSHNSSDSILQQMVSTPNPQPPLIDPDSDPVRTELDNEYLKIQKSKIKQEWVAFAAILATCVLLLCIFYNLTSAIKVGFINGANKNFSESVKLTEQNNEIKPALKKIASDSADALVKVKPEKEEGLNQKSNFLDWHFLVFCSALLLAPVFMLTRMATLIFNRGQSSQEHSLATDLPGGLILEAVKTLPEQIANLLKK